ncbi:LpqB family beta-propeller domain-containing protein [Arthrobacter sp. NPDC090010]|uniref:LpqB family beta-propeller domain-containing protein n=1 Tax=Arthrobacter sp. NPDC090010 TaxID=3363942 RepID=UPI0038050EAD
MKVASGLNGRRRPVTPLRVALAWVISLAVLLGTGACASIPRSGSVHKSEGDSTSQLGNPPAVYFPPGPGNGASPQTIIEDFYNAGSSYERDYALARQFLTQDAAASWKPDDQALVYRSAKVVKGTGDSGFFYDLDLAYAIDAQGIVTAYPAGTVRKVPLSLTQVDGQWRIRSLSDGTVIPEEIFHGLYQPYTVYFYDPSYQYAVPDIRWFINRPTVTKSIVSAVLAGPAPYLKGAVVSAFPAGARLAKESVPVVSGAAQVDFTEDLLQSSVTDRHRMLNQLTIALRATGSVVNVQLLAGSTVVNLDDSDSVTPPMVNRPVPNWQVALLQGQLSTFENNKAQKIPGIDISGFAPRHPAAAEDQHAYAFVNQQASDMFLVRPGQPNRDILSGANLVRPSFDPQGWVWGGGSAAKGPQLTAVDTKSGVDPKNPPSITFGPDWLQGYTLKDAQLSRDGTRVLILAEKGKSTSVYVAGVVRGADGAPRALTEPLKLPDTRNVNQGAWVSDTIVVVANTSGTGAEAPVRLSLKSFQPVVMPDVVGLQGISAGNGVSDIYVQTGAGVSQQIGNTWVQQGAGVKDPKFAG